MPDQWEGRVGEESGPPHETIGHLLRRVFAGITAEAMRDGVRSRDFVVLDILADENAPSRQDPTHHSGAASPHRTARQAGRQRRAGHHSDSSGFTYADMGI